MFWLEHVKAVPVPLRLNLELKSNSKVARWQVKTWQSNHEVVIPNNILDTERVF